MASQFQNRLMGTIVLVAIGVIVLPFLLDGEKKHYEEQFAAIPLVPKAGDQQDMDILPSVTQPLSLPLVEEQAKVDPQQQSLPAEEHGNQAISPLVTPPVTDRPALADQTNKTLPTAVAPEKRPTLNENQGVTVKRPAEDRVLPVQSQEKPPQERAPVGEAYVVQLGALKNAAKVDEIVAMLRLSGYSVYTIPSKPVGGQLTRIYVGPDMSKQKLQSQIAELQRLSGLGGQVRNYTPR